MIHAGRHSPSCSDLGVTKITLIPMQDFPKAAQFRLTARRTGPSSVITLLEQRGNGLKFWCIPSFGGSSSTHTEQGGREAAG